MTDLRSIGFGPGFIHEETATCSNYVVLMAAAVNISAVQAEVEEALLALLLLILIKCNQLVRMIMMTTSPR
jgi:hypothetical protein